jgi:hypothetical protein
MSLSQPFVTSFFELNTTPPSISNTTLFKVFKI